MPQRDQTQRRSLRRSLLLYGAILRENNTMDTARWTIESKKRLSHTYPQTLYNDLFDVWSSCASRRALFLARCGLFVHPVLDLLSVGLPSAVQQRAAVGLVGLSAAVGLRAAVSLRAGVGLRAAVSVTVGFTVVASRVANFSFSC